jgi:hypothetical protein
MSGCGRALVITRKEWVDIIPLHRQGLSIRSISARWTNADALLADAKVSRNGLHLLDEPLPGSPASSTLIRTASPASASRAKRS